MTWSPSDSEFLKQVDHHQLIVVHDEGLHRHLTLKRPTSSNRYFHITTWPGYLTISGDMNCYVFARLPDMFEFFRDDGGNINPSYWAEKIQADQKGSGHREFSAPKYRQAIVSIFKSYYPQGTPDRMRIWADVREELLDWNIPENTHDAISVAMRYKDPVKGNQPFSDFWDRNLEDYTYHFIWCCRAIVWAIERYDEYKADQRFPGLARLHAERAREVAA